MRAVSRLAGSAVAFACLLAPPRASAEGEARERPDAAVKGVAGFAYAFPQKRGDEPTPDGKGFGIYLDAEYVLWPESWFSPRAYSGLVVAPPFGGRAVLA